MFAVGPFTSRDPIIFATFLRDRRPSNRARSSYYGDRQEIASRAVAMRGGSNPPSAARARRSIRHEGINLSDVEWAPSIIRDPSSVRLDALMDWKLDTAGRTPRTAGGCRSAARSAARSVGRSVGVGRRSIGRSSVDRSVGRSVGRSVDRSIGRSFDLYICRLVGRSVGWSVSRSVGRSFRQ